MVGDCFPRIISVVGITNKDVHCFESEAKIKVIIAFIQDYLGWLKASRSAKFNMGGGERVLM